MHVGNAHDLMPKKSTKEAALLRASEKALMAHATGRDGIPEMASLSNLLLNVNGRLTSLEGKKKIYARVQKSTELAPEEGKIGKLVLLLNFGGNYQGDFTFELPPELMDHHNLHEGTVVKVTAHFTPNPEQNGESLMEIKEVRPVFPM